MTSTQFAVSSGLEQLVEVETPEQVAFSYTVAGIGSRAAAAIIDHALIGTMILGLWMLVAMLAAAIGGLGRKSGMSGSWALAVAILLGFAFTWGYYVVFEAIWDGQTPGKRKLGIRVVQDGGYSVSFAASAVRNLVRIVDMQPGGVYAIGILSATFSKSGKRLGDILAGTFVVQERLVHIAPATTVPAARGAADVPITARLSTQEYELLERFLARRGELESERRRDITAQLAERFREHFPDQNGSPMFLLMRLFESEQAARARGVASRGATGAAREQHALVANNAPRWSAFAKALAEAQQRGLRSMSPAEVSRFVAEYREVATDLARLRTAARGRDIDALFYVSRLVGAGHNLLYRQKTLSMRNAWRYVSVGVPREVRRSGRYILLGALFLFGPMAVTYGAVMRRPALAEELLPSMVDRVNEGVARAKRGGQEYITTKDFERPVMASTIIANNVQVTYAVFAFGITFGVLTIVMLVFNGVSIGAAFGLYASKGIFWQIRNFVIPHSVLELSAICIAAGGGLLIASALLLPGAITRREALVVKGRRAIRLITASTIMLLMAGTIEGLISPRADVPVSVKVGVAVATAIFLLFWFTQGRGADDAELPMEENAYSDARALISR